MKYVSLLIFSVGFSLGTVSESIARCPGPGCPTAPRVAGSKPPTSKPRPTSSSRSRDIVGGALLGAVIGGILHSADNCEFDGSGTCASRNRSNSGATASQRTSLLAREEARNVQRSLNLLGFDVGVEDGIIGKKTRAGIMAYQLAIGLTPSGYLDINQVTELLLAAEIVLQSNYSRELTVREAIALARVRSRVSVPIFR